METGKSKDSEIIVIHENLAHGVQTANAYVEYDDKQKEKEQTCWYFCLACLSCG